VKEYKVVDRWKMFDWLTLSVAVKKRTHKTFNNTRTVYGTFEPTDEGKKK
jgi:hypothetical protein